MTDAPVRGSAGHDQEQSLGALVSQAIADVSMLLRCELDLAKLELKDDAKRAAIAVAALAMAAFVGCLVLVLLCFAFAYGLMSLGIWGWASFLIVAGTCVLLAAGAVLLGILRFRGMTGLRKTRGTVRDGISVLRRRGENKATASVTGSSSAL
jgi:Putative Actinobacterial Holin-X, holin superfamily III